jgi:hypothetical protein
VASRPRGGPVVGITRKWGECWHGCRLETRDSDVACRADRCSSSMRRLCYGQALAPVTPPSSGGPPCARRSGPVLPPLPCRGRASELSTGLPPPRLVDPAWLCPAVERQHSRRAKRPRRAFVREASGAPLCGQRPTATFISGSCPSRSKSIASSWPQAIANLSRDLSCLGLLLLHLVFAVRTQTNQYRA